MWEIVKMAVIELFWPIVKEVVKKYGKQLIEWLIEKFKTWATSRNASQADFAEQKAEQAEAAARTAASPSDAQTHEAVAKVWREVAEMFRQEKEALAEELRKLRAAAVAENNAVADQLTYDKVVDEKDGKLHVNEELPRITG